MRLPALLWRRGRKGTPVFRPAPLREAQGERVTPTEKKRGDGLERADPTLYLRIAPGGLKSWVQRLTIDGRRHDLGLGGFPLVTLAEAREQAFENRRRVRAPMATTGQGHPDPIDNDLAQPSSRVVETRAEPSHSGSRYARPRSCRWVSLAPRPFSIRPAPVRCQA